MTLPRLPAAASLALASLLCACERSITVDLAVSGSDTLSSAILPVTAVRLLDDDDATTSLDASSATDDANLAALAPDDTLQLVSDAEVDEGRYAGLALHFDGDAASIRPADGDTASLATPDTDLYADLDLTLEENGSAHLLAVLDLRFSLSDQGGTLGQWYLRPHVRVVDLDSYGGIAGTVASPVVEDDACRDGRDAGEGVAVYVYAGSNVTPNDYVAGYTGASAPVASAQVAAASDGAGYAFSLPWLAPGDYTLALTCEGDAEDPLTDQGLDFGTTRDVTVAAGGVASATLP